MKDPSPISLSTTSRALLLALACLATADPVAAFLVGNGPLSLVKDRRHSGNTASSAATLSFVHCASRPSSGSIPCTVSNHFTGPAFGSTANNSQRRATARAGRGSIEAAMWPPTDRLSEYVTEANLVDYSKIAQQEGEWLEPVVSLLKATDPGMMEPGAERHAFLINAYNLWTIHWVIRERRWPWWKGATSALAKAKFFYWNRISTAAGSSNLYDLENKDIRPEMNDARVHFALNCASMSCPPLRRTLFTATGLESELDEVTSANINGGAFVQLSPDGKLRVNPIFKWYKEDFDKEGGALAFIRKYWKGATPLPEDPQIEFFKYDWRSNNADSTWSDRPLGGPAP